MNEKRPGVLDPQWEDELRAGQEADGGQGSVEAELAIVHLFRHAAGPETLEPDAVDAIWAEVAGGIEAASGFTPWWRRALDWRVGLGVAVAAAAAFVLVIAIDPTPEPASGDRDPVAQREGAEGLSSTLQAQFDLLAPQARVKIEADVDDGRGAVRQALIESLESLESAREGTLGGAP